MDVDTPEPSSEALKDQGNTFYKAGNFDDAIEMYTRAIEAGIFFSFSFRTIVKAYFSKKKRRFSN